MPSYKFPASDRIHVEHWLSDSGSVLVKPRDYRPWSLGKFRAQRFICSDGTSQAFARVVELSDQPDWVFVIVSFYPPRLPLFWRWWGDFRLVRRLAEVLEQNGGELVRPEGS